MEQTNVLVLLSTLLLISVKYSMLDWMSFGLQLTRKSSGHPSFLRSERHPNRLKSVILIGPELELEAQCQYTISPWEALVHTMDAMGNIHY